ncbi:polysaccharide biosynthesis/export family protein [Parafilimonas sp.]|uniref:polysaccharide biosynthesis/export family protein n=1 Tax=Parafilimonas sp. TaxID=1969739 RepID=UPI0039E41A1D
MINFKSGLILLATAVVLFTSCVAPKNITYFEDLPDSLKEAETVSVPFKNPLIKPDDLLFINIQTLDPEANVLFSAVNTTVAAVGANSNSMAGNQVTSGLLVDKDGCIILPVVGKIKVEGYTTQQARDSIKSRIDKYYTQSTVDVRYNNFKITVIGEVNHPSTFVVPNEEVTVLDALGMAGDLTIYGRRENVLLIRKDTGDIRKFIRLNLNSKDLVSSPYYFLKQGDVLYVEPNKAKAYTLDSYRTRNYAIAASVLSLLIVIATRVK